MNNRLEEYLKSDRQWLRPQRLDHAKYMLRHTATTDTEEYEFWREVIKANSLTVEKRK